MANSSYVLALDQGTTSSRAMAFDAGGRPLASAQRELEQIYPDDGWVEHDAEAIWRDTVACARQVVAELGIEGLDSIGITNQRETTVLWERGSGRPVHNAIVWQDRRTAARCTELERQGLGELVQQRTGLLLDPYFSATKLAWLLDSSSEIRSAAERSELAFGTVDCFLLWRLTGGRVHATDASNAARTMLFDIHRQEWDGELLQSLAIPPGILPQVLDSSAEFGTTETDILGRTVAVTGIAGDQQAATFGQAAFAPGSIKSTYGTGCFVMLNTGDQAVRSRNRLLSTVAWRLGGEVSYALEGSIFNAGTAVQWLRDELGLIATAAESETLAAGIEDTGGVYLVPAFTGLGAPYWQAQARGALVGLTRDSSRAEVVRAALEAVCYQTRDLLDAMAADGAQIGSLRVDGGMVANDWLLQFLADVLGRPVERPVVSETTALGAAYLAGLTSGFYPSLEVIAEHWQRQRVFVPAMAEEQRETLYAGWQTAVARTLV
ncbi:MAG: glycerol kinase GlpK [Alphaproteobacteria bacterium]|jgi:glycerol kinase|nr:glycerol kinase [Rhodospirillaceae bacterium]MDP6405177.1 glycerol kinase GlpK [Alphaproteobacteria bacterium]MDP6624181.1 glycerol kinase GlpK [Alphaproteobacteria bacterium]